MDPRTESDEGREDDFREEDRPVPVISQASLDRARGYLADGRIAEAWDALGGRHSSDKYAELAAVIVTFGVADAVGTREDMESHLSNYLEKTQERPVNGGYLPPTADEILESYRTLENSYPPLAILDRASDEFRRVSDEILESYPNLEITYPALSNLDRISIADSMLEAVGLHSDRVGSGAGSYVHNPHLGEGTSPPPGGHPNPHESEGTSPPPGGRPNPHESEGTSPPPGGRPNPHEGEGTSPPPGGRPGGRPNPHEGEGTSPPPGGRPGGRPNPHEGEGTSPPPGGRPGGRPNPHEGEGTSPPPGGRPNPHEGEGTSPPPGGRPNPHEGEGTSPPPGGRPNPHEGEGTSPPPGGRPNPHEGEGTSPPPGGRPNPHEGEGGGGGGGGGGSDGGGGGGGGGGGDGGGGGGGDGGGGGKPVFLDLDGDGVELVSLENSTAFYDIHGDGFRYNLSWVAADDGILAYDRDGDGRISEHEEISFVDYVEGARTDLEGLRHFDTNGNNHLTTADAEWSKFRVWQDLDQDGVSDPDELRTLDAAGVRSISLQSTGDVETRTDGTRVLGPGDVYHRQRGLSGHPRAAGRLACGHTVGRAPDRRRRGDSLDRRR